MFQFSSLSLLFPFLSPLLFFIFYCLRDCVGVLLVIIIEVGLIAAAIIVTFVWLSLLCSICHLLCIIMFSVLLRLFLCHCCFCCYVFAVFLLSLLMLQLLQVVFFVVGVNIAAWVLL